MEELEKELFEWKDIAGDLAVKAQEKEEWRNIAFDVSDKMNNELNFWKSFAKQLADCLDNEIHGYRNEAYDIALAKKVLIDFYEFENNLNK
jgi:hypothetical protein